MHHNPRLKGLWCKSKSFVSVRYYLYCCFIYQFDYRTRILDI